MGASAKILSHLRTDPQWKDTKVAYVSCTDEPDWAEECMDLFRAGSLSLQQTVDIKEIYKANKNKHFQSLHKKTGIPYEDMIFFDNENHNCVNVQPLGVTCIYTPKGMTQEAWEQGLAKHAKAEVSAR